MCPVRLRVRPAFSSRITASDARATAAASGLPPKVDPCSPGVKRPKKGLICQNRRDRIEAARQCLPNDDNIRADILVICRQTVSRSVPRPVWISSAMNRTLFFLQISATLRR